MEYEAECFSTFARLLDLPDEAFRAQLSVVTDPELVSPEIAGHVALFAERVAELSLDERRELFAETFGGPAIARDRALIAEVLRRGSGEELVAMVAALDRVCGALSRDRNPYLHLCVAVRSLLALA